MQELICFPVMTVKFVLDPLAIPWPNKIISAILEAQKKAPIPPKSCLVTFTQQDHNEAILYVIANALTNKIPVIASATMLKKLIEKYPNIAQHFT